MSVVAAITLFMGATPSVIAMVTVVPMVLFPAVATVVVRHWLPRPLHIVRGRSCDDIGLPDHDHRGTGIDRRGRQVDRLRHGDDAGLLPDRWRIADTD